MYVKDSARLRAESHALGCGLALVVGINMFCTEWLFTQCRGRQPLVLFDQRLISSKVLLFWLAERYSATSHGCNAGTHNVHWCVIPLCLCGQSMKNCCVYVRSRVASSPPPLCSSRRGFMKLQRDWEFLPLPEEIPQKTARGLIVSTPD